MMGFQAGQKVRLISGGDRMVIERTDETRCYCVWSRKGHTKREWFETVTLELVPKENFSKVISTNPNRPSWVDARKGKGWQEQ